MQPHDLFDFTHRYPHHRHIELPPFAKGPQILYSILFFLITVFVSYLLLQGGGYFAAESVATLPEWVATLQRNTHVLGIFGIIWKYRSLSSVKRCISGSNHSQNYRTNRTFAMSECPITSARYLCALG